MYELNNDRYYYLTLMNENYTHPSRPNGVTNKMIMQGAYPYLKDKSSELRILASGITLNFALKAQTILKNFGVKIDVWSITSFNELYRDGIKSDRALRLNQESNKSYVQECLTKFTNYSSF